MRARILRRLRGLAVVSFYLYGIWSHACADLLESDSKRIEAKRLSFGANARADLKRLKISEDRFRGLVAANTSFAIPLGERDMWSIVFEPNPAREDRGIYVLGHMEQGYFSIDHVKMSFPAQEVFYFRAVATLHQIAPVELKLPSPLFNCQTLVVEGWRQAKIWLKHRVTIADISSILPTARVADDSSRSTPRHWLTGRDERRRRLRVVIEESAHCPHGLVTAFELN